MPINPPVLDDRSFEELVDELLRRIPAHTPEWTHPRVGDPGRTLIDLFAWLVDTVLYRINLVPERQRLVFLQLLGMPMRPAHAATGLVSVLAADDDVSAAVTLRPRALIQGPAVFETLRELTVLPVSAEVFVKASLPPAQEAAMAPVVGELMGLYGIDGARAYVTTSAFPGGRYRADGIDLAADTVDRGVWLALLAGAEADVDTVRETLGGTADGRPQTLSLAVVPTLAPTQPLEEVGARVPVAHGWEVCTGREVDGQPVYLPLDVLSDGTEGLTRAGIVRVALPDREHLGTLPDDVRQSLHAGVGDRPPRLDDADKAARVVTWLRLRTLGAAATGSAAGAGDATVSLRLSWMGINAVDVDQRQTMTDLVIGQSDGSADQVLALPRASVERDSFVLQVEEPGMGYRTWRATDDRQGGLHTEGPEARAFALDAEAGRVRFGDGMRGRIPEPGARIRVAMMRVGGGVAGNLPPGSLAGISAMDLAGAPVVAPRLTVVQGVPTRGGVDAETLAEAEQRIPATLRHRDRAVTPDDFRQLAVETPGTRIGRVEVLPRFLPGQRRDDVPGVVSVMVLPRKGEPLAPNPRPDRALLGAVHSYLDLRRPIGTELYVIGTEYVPLGLSAAIGVRDGFGVEETIQAVRVALRRFLWSLAPGGPQQSGWPLGRPVQDKELEVVVAQVAGVRTVGGVNLFTTASAAAGAAPASGARWQRVAGASRSAPAALALAHWQLPELLAVVVAEGTTAATTLTTGLPGDGSAGGQGIPVPVVPEVC